MRDKALFVGASIVVSVALFALIAWAVTLHVYVPAEVGYLVPAVAVMACALGVGWRRKATSIALTVGGFTLFDAVTRATGLQSIASRPLAGRLGEQATVGLALIYALVPLVYPLAALVLFVGRRPSVLWTAPEAPRGAPKRRARVGKRPGR